MNATMPAMHVSDFLGMNYTTLCYWVQTNLLHVSGGRSKGARWAFTGSDVMRAMTVKELKNKGASLQAIRRAIDSLENLHDINDWQHEFLGVAPDGNVVWLASRRGKVVWLDKDLDIINPVTGQIYMIDVGNMKAQVKAEFEAREKAKRAKSTSRVKRRLPR